MCHNKSACHAYVMWAELGHGGRSFNVPAVSDAVTTGNGTGTKNGTVHFGLCLVSSLLSMALLP